MNVLVHCKEGDNKSASLVAAYLIYKFKIDTEKALQVVKAHRPSISIS
jgi:protein-tyrosine phosphatase